MQNANWHPLSKCQCEKTNQNKNKDINHLKDYIAHYWITSKLHSLQKQERRKNLLDLREVTTYFSKRVLTCKYPHMYVLPLCGQDL